MQPKQVMEAEGNLRAMLEQSAMLKGAPLSPTLLLNRSPFG